MCVTERSRKVHIVLASYIYVLIFLIYALDLNKHLNNLSPTLSPSEIIKSAKKI